MRSKTDLMGLEKFARQELKILEGNVLGLDIYRAGKNKNKRGGFNFYARDLILSAILMDDTQLLKKSLELCAILQGKKKNPSNGEEKGKIFHEYPEKPKKVKDGLNSGFNASDTTSLFLIGMSRYFKKTGDREFLIKYEDNIRGAEKYILKHIKDDIFWEDPKFCGAKKFRLLSTYWKDTGFLGRKDFKPVYPVAYTLLQTQVLCSLRCASHISEVLYGKKENYFLKLADRMNRELWKRFWDKKSKNFSVGIDAKGLIQSNSSDYLHLLFYLEKKDVPRRKLLAIVKRGKELATKYGYRGAVQNGFIDPYYSAIWPWEQGFIFLAGIKHNIKEIREISANSLRIISEMKCFPEIVKYFDGNLENMKYNTQLWTIAYALLMVEFYKNNK